MESFPSPGSAAAANMVMAAIRIKLDGHPGSHRRGCHAEGMGAQTHTALDGSVLLGRGLLFGTLVMGFDELTHLRERSIDRAPPRWKRFAPASGNS